MPVSMSPQQFRGSPPPPPLRRTGLQMDSPLTRARGGGIARQGVVPNGSGNVGAEQSAGSAYGPSCSWRSIAGCPWFRDFHIIQRGPRARKTAKRAIGTDREFVLDGHAEHVVKRMKPASQVPKTMEELAATDLSMVHYLERFGGYGNVRDMGICQYALSYVVELRGDLQGLRENLALLEASGVWVSC